MRLWSIHPKYLDRQGLLAVWREGLLAQKVLLQGEYKECINCNGFGAEDIDKYGHFHGTTIRTCKKCKGTGKIKTPYYNHPQLKRFKQNKKMLEFYLLGIYLEASQRGYNFNDSLIKAFKTKRHLLTVTTGQLEYEFNHLQKKLHKRTYKKYRENNSLVRTIHEYEPHPLFKVVEGSIEKCEKVK